MQCVEKILQQKKVFRSNKKLKESSNDLIKTKVKIGTTIFENSAKERSKAHFSFAIFFKRKRSVLIIET